MPNDYSTLQDGVQRLDSAHRCRFLIALGFNLTISARDTYEVGTDGVAKPSDLRHYNEVMHRVLSNAGQLLSGQCEEAWCLDLVLSASRNLPLIGTACRSAFASVEASRDGT
jgi:hypothetical protein